MAPSVNVSMETLRQGAQALGISLGQEQLWAFQLYYLELARHAPYADLTSVTDLQGVQRRHFLESLALGRRLLDMGLLPAGEEEAVIDIGTGGGFPSLPIRLVWDFPLTLLEADGRKVRFLKRLVALLGLQHVQIIWGRAEEVAHLPQHRETYRLALARAVAPLPVLVELALPFLEVGGALATPKGERAYQEIEEAAAALRELGGEVVHVAPLTVPGPGPYPTLVVVTKARPSPLKYPRRPGVPQKRPLR